MGDEPVDRATLGDLFELARWAPNHHMSNPWRFRVLGPRTLAVLRQLAEADRPGAGARLGDAPTLVVVSSIRHAEPHRLEQDLLSTGIAAYILTLAAHGRGLASYWRSPHVLRTPEGRAALGIAEGSEECIGMIHLGSPGPQPGEAERRPVAELVTYLD